VRELGEPVSIGSIAAGEKRILPPHLVGPPAQSHILIAEGVRSRTRRWNPTLNVIGRESVFHRLVYPKHAKAATVATENQMEFGDYIALSREALLVELANARRESQRALRPEN
jgi:hypothetical protein